MGDGVCAEDPLSSRVSNSSTQNLCRFYTHFWYTCIQHNVSAP